MSVQAQRPLLAARVACCRSVLLQLDDGVWAHPARPLAAARWVGGARAISVAHVAWAQHALRHMAGTTAAGAGCMFQPPTTFAGTPLVKRGRPMSQHCQVRARARWGWDRGSCRLLVRSSGAIHSRRALAHLLHANPLRCPAFQHVPDLLRARQWWCAPGRLPSWAQDSGHRPCAPVAPHHGSANRRPACSSRAPLARLLPCPWPPCPRLPPC